MKINILNTFIIVMIFVSIVGVLANVITNATTDKNQSDTINVFVQQNTSVALTKIRVIEIVNITNTTNHLIGAGNYSLNADSDGIVVLDNGSTDTSWGGSEWVVNYNHQDGVLTGASGVVVGLLLLLVVLLFVVNIIRQAKNMR